MATSLHPQVLARGAQVLHIIECTVFCTINSLSNSPELMTSFESHWSIVYAVIAARQFVRDFPTSAFSVPWRARWNPLRFPLFSDEKQQAARRLVLRRRATRPAEGWLRGSESWRPHGTLKISLGSTDPHQIRLFSKVHITPAWCNVSLCFSWFS